MKIKNKKTLILIIGIALIISGVAYAFFSYAKNGTKGNTIKSGKISFHYSEGNRSISLYEMLPMTDNQGKAQSDYFEFDITSDTSDTIDIPYYITARKSANSDNIDSVIKVYLTKVDNSGNETQVYLGNYNTLNQYVNSDIDVSNHTEKLVYNDLVYAGTRNYEQKYRLRMWIDINAEFIVQNNGVDTYPYEDKQFTLTVNVYSNGSTVDNSTLTTRTDTSIQGMNIVGTSNIQATTTDNINYTATTSEQTISIEVNPTNPNATVDVTQTDSTFASNINVNEIQRLSTSQEFPLTPGNNYFKIVIISQDKQETEEYHLTVVRGLSTDATLSSLTFDGCSVNETLSSSTSYTCAASKSNITFTGTTTDSNATVAVSGNTNATINSQIKVIVTAEDGTTKKTYTITVASLSFNPTSINDSLSISYTGQETAIAIQKTGNYKLEVWGAQGGTETITHGLGGYSRGTVVLNNGETIYVNVGGQGKKVSGVNNSGGYNGGGAGAFHDNGAVPRITGASGGGATHIARHTGLLSDLVLYKSDILIVAGGGGGDGALYASYQAGIGGAGGGSVGGNTNPDGGTQTTGYAFGQGESVIQKNATDRKYIANNGYGNCGGGGGGGYWGGYVYHKCRAPGGAGGSGYLNTSVLTNAGMYCYTGCSGENTTVVTVYGEHIPERANTGNGYARITYLGD